jgi:UDP-2,3-diacylglucosamine pyrophosphatase LpxH
MEPPHHQPPRPPELLLAAGGAIGLIGTQGLVTNHAPRPAPLIRPRGVIDAAHDPATLSFRTVLLSDIHLGSPDCHVERVVDLLAHLRCEHLILVGDIVDFWKLSRGGRWHADHLRVLTLILDKLARHRTKVTYLRGNHDDLLRHLSGVSVDGLSVQETLTLDMAGRRYLVLHGDVFDHTVRTGWVPAKLVDGAYNSLLAVNRVYNWQRRRRGLEGYSIAGAIKRRVGGAVRYVERFEHHMASLARAQGCDGVICGHIHCPADAVIDGIHYLNCGDWVESMTGVCLSWDDKISVRDWSGRRLAPRPD